MNLNELEAAVSKMTPGPWHWSQGCHHDATLWLEGQFDQGVLSCICHRDGECMFPDDPDKEGIVALRNAAPELIAAAREREGLKEKLDIANHWRTCYNDQAKTNAAETLAALAQRDELADALRHILKCDDPHAPDSFAWACSIARAALAKVTPC